MQFILHNKVQDVYQISLYLSEDEYYSIDMRRREFEVFEKEN